MGALHAYGALLEAVEQQFQVSRVWASSIYGVSLFSATLAVLLGPYVFARFAPARLALVLILIVLSTSLLVVYGGYWQWLLGHGLLFGIASGGGYALALYVAARSVPNNRQGLALGMVTAAYALGSAWFAVFYPWALAYYSLSHTYLIGMLQVLALCGLALLLWRSHKQLTVATQLSSDAAMPQGIGRLWLAYACGVFAGLMTIGHALPLMKLSLVEQGVAVAALALMSLANGLASLLAGALADRWGCVYLLRRIAAVSALALVCLAYSSGVLAVLLLVLIGAMYGAFIAVYPTFINRLFGLQHGPAVYGRVFTAWGIAGLLAAPTAAWLFQVSQNYHLALLIAAGLALTSVLLMAPLEDK